MKHDDEACQRQVQKPVHERTGFSVAAQEDEELHPCPGLQDVRETNDSEQNDGKDFNRSLHPLLRNLRTRRRLGRHRAREVWRSWNGSNVGAERWERVRVRDGWPEPPRTIAPLVCAGTEAGELWTADEPAVHCSED